MQVGIRGVKSCLEISSEEIYLGLVYINSVTWRSSNLIGSLSLPNVYARVILVFQAI